jgi:hypothetical protein
MTLEAAEKNCLILKHHNVDLGAAIKAQPKSPVGYCSEFQKPWMLSPLLENHPLWPQMKSILENGTWWPITPISKKECISNLKEALKFCNHKGAKSQPELLLKLVSNNIIYGYTTTLPLDKVIRNPHMCMAPLNIQGQWTVNALCEIVSKDHLTHDQSSKWETFGTSINLCFDPDKLPKCMFGKCLLHLINWTVAPHWKYPNCIFFAKKDNFNSVYCHCHLHWETTSKTITQIPELNMAFMNL